MKVCTYVSYLCSSSLSLLYIATLFCPIRFVVLPVVFLFNSISDIVTTGHSVALLTLTKRVVVPLILSTGIELYGSLSYTVKEFNIFIFSSYQVWVCGKSILALAVNVAVSPKHTCASVVVIALGDIGALIVTWDVAKFKSATCISSLTSRTPILPAQPRREPNELTLPLIHQRIVNASELDVISPLLP